MNELLTTKELAAIWKVSENTIRNYRVQGMPHIKIGRSIRFEPLAVMQWLKDKSEGLLSNE